MIDLKKEFKAFNKPQNAILNLTQNLKTIRLVDDELQVVLHGNFGLTDLNNASLSFPNPGTWYNYFTGEEINVTGNAMAFRLRANEFMLFTNRKLTTPEGDILMEDLITSIDKERIDISDFNIYPVPSQSRLYVVVPEALIHSNFRIIDVTGKTIREGTSIAIDNILQLDIAEFKAGLYIFEIFDNRQVLRKRFIKQ